MDEKFQFRFVYEDNSDSVELDRNRKVKAIRISSDCDILLEHIQTTGFSSCDAYNYACSHQLKMITPQDVKIIRNRLSGVRMMLKKSGASVMIDHKCIVWTSDGCGDYRDMEAYSLSSGKCMFMGVHEIENEIGVIYKLG